MALRMLLTITSTTAAPTAPSGASVRTDMRKAMPAAKSSDTKMYRPIAVIRHSPSVKVKVAPSGDSRGPEPKAISPMMNDAMGSVAMAPSERTRPTMSFCFSRRRRGMGAARR